jgi:hypothetical protein
LLRVVISKVVSLADSPSQFTRASLCKLLSNLECWAAFVAFSFCEYLDRGECYHIFCNWEWIKTLCLMTILLFMCFFPPNTGDTRFGFYLGCFFFLTKISQDLLCLFKNLRFFNDMSNNNIHATLIIYISIWRKIFNHGDWFRRWHDQKIDVFSQVQECRSNK